MKTLGLLNEYRYVKRRLIESGIDFNRIPMEDILTTCKQYDGAISPQNYDTVVKAIEDIYRVIKCRT